MRDASRADGVSLDRFLSRVGAIRHAGSPCLPWKRVQTRHSLSSSHAQMPRFWLRGTQWGCAAPVLQTTERMTCLSPITAPVDPLVHPAPGFDGPLSRMWSWPKIISVGVAASAVNAGVELCKNKTPAYQGIPLKQQQLAQFLLGKAASQVEAARDSLFRAADAAYADVEISGKSLSVQSKARVQLAVSFAAEACAEAVRFINDVVGTSSIRAALPRSTRSAATFRQVQPAVRLRRQAHAWSGE
jgi:hypothetical protein